MLALLFNLRGLLHGWIWCCAGWKTKGTAVRPCASVS